MLLTTIILSMTMSLTFQTLLLSIHENQIHKSTDSGMYPNSCLVFYPISADIVSSSSNKGTLSSTDLQNFNHLFGQIHFEFFPGKNSVSISLTCSSKYYYVAFGNRDGSGINEFIWKCNVEGSHNMRSGGGAVLVPLL